MLFFVQSNQRLPFRLSEPPEGAPDYPAIAENVTIPANLYHGIMRVKLGERPTICRTSVLLDTYPIAIPLKILAPKDHDMIMSGHQQFKAPHTENLFTPNPAFCLKVIAQAITAGGKMTLDDVNDGHMFTCASTRNSDVCVL